jgi:laminin alpha 1/2
MELGSESASMGAERARGIEQCECPPGYAGLSCEECAFGYVRRQQPKSLTTSGGQQQLGECVACQCHGHAATCLATDLTACSPCLHNTTGAQCQQCSVGFYGDARTGAVDACRKCYCPLAVESNNFSPTCHSAAPDNNNGYVCDRCPVGHEGQHCERFVHFFTPRYRTRLNFLFFLN